MIRRMKLRYKILAPLGLAFVLLCIAKPSIALAPVRMIGIQLTPQAAVPFASGKGGLWIKSSDYSINYRNPNTNADTALGAGGGGGGTGTLQQSYTAGSAGAQIVTEDSTRLGTTFKAYTGQSADVFDVQTSTGATILALPQAGTLTMKSGVASNATTAMIFDTSVDYKGGAGYPFQINNNGSPMVQFETSSYLGGETSMQVYYTGSPVGGFTWFNAGAFTTIGNIDWRPHADDLSNLGTSSFRWATVQSFQYAGVNQTIAAAASITINAALGESARVTLGATAITGITVSAGQPGEIMTIEIVQDATGSRAISGWPATVKFAGGAYTVTATANKRDTLTFRYDSVDSNWYEMSRAMNE